MAALFLLALAILVAVALTEIRVYYSPERQVQRWQHAMHKLGEISRDDYPLPHPRTDAPAAAPSDRATVTG